MVRISMTGQKKILHKDDVGQVNRAFENCVGCKWTLSVIGQIRNGINRPGALERAIAGISTKVLNQRLRKLVGYGIIERTSFPEVPPRVEYYLTPFGRKFAKILDQIESLAEELA